METSRPSIWGATPATFSRVEAGYHTSTVALRAVEDDGKGTQFLGVYLGHPITVGHKYRDLVLQVGFGRKADCLPL
jgi:hypothetical protein